MKNHKLNTCLLPTSTTGFHQHQQGSVLVISLILLMVLTLLGISSIRNATMQERMSGAMRDQSIAFQAAEAALREGEAYLRSESKPIVLKEPDKGLYHWANNPVPADLAGAKWQKAQALTGSSSPPEYIIEQLGRSAGTSSVPTEKVVTSLSADTDFVEEQGQLFRITARGYGGSAHAVVLLQSTYRP